MRAADSYTLFFFMQAVKNVQLVGVEQRTKSRQGAQETRETQRDRVGRTGVKRELTETKGKWVEQGRDEDEQELHSHTQVKTYIRIFYSVHNR